MRNNRPAKQTNQKHNATTQQRNNSIGKHTVHKHQPPPIVICFIMSSTILLNTLKKVPFPLFGTASTALTYTARKATILPKLSPWVVPAGAGVLWFVWPAVDEEWKQSIFGSSSSTSSSAPAPAPQLSEEAKVKVETAYVVETKELTEQEKAVVKAVAKGDFTLLEQEWDTFQEKASIPGDGDDDDEDEEDDDDVDEEEEEDDDDEEE